MADIINHPAHYNRSSIEPINVIEKWDLNFNLGNVIKYVERAGYKDPSKTIEDLKKARWYLDREIKRLNKSQIQSMSAQDKKLVDNSYTLCNGCEKVLEEK